MNSNYKLSKTEAIMFILIIIVNKIILNLPKEIIKSTGTGALINIVTNGALVLIIVIFISYLYQKFQNEDIIDISEYLRWKATKIHNINSLYWFIYANQFNNFN